MPECLRLFALFGIVAVIVQVVAFSALEGMVAPAGETARDAVSVWLVNGRAVLKTCGLCAFMCGVGLCLFRNWPDARLVRYGVLTPGSTILRVCAEHCPRPLAQLGPPGL